MNLSAANGMRLGFILFTMALWPLAHGAMTVAQESERRALKPTAASSTKSAVGSTRINNEIANQRIVDGLRSSANLPPNIEMWIVGRHPSQYPGMDEATLKIGEGSNISRQDVLISRDNAYAFVGRVVDLHQDPYRTAMKKIDLTNSPMRGPQGAKVVMIEFSDFECPLCGQAYHIVETDVMKQYGTKIKMVYKNYPLPNHAWAEAAAVAAMCAKAQKNEAFWVLYDGFFDNQLSITADNVKSKALEFARKGNLDVSNFERCYDAKQTLAQIKADMAEGEALGLTGTPLFLINGHPVPGAQPFSEFQKVIEEELKKLSK